MRNLFLIISLLFLVGCGGGSDSSDGEDTSDNGNTYDLRNIFKKNYSFTASMSSTANDDKFKYLVSSTVQAKTALNGKDVIPISTISSISNETTGAGDSFNITTYYNLNGTKVQSENHDTGVTCTLTNTPTLLPGNSKVGDSGVGSYMDCTDGTSLKETWTLISKNNGVWLQENIKLYDANGGTSMTEIDQYKIDIHGNISKVSLQLYYIPNDVTLKVPETSVNAR